MSAELDDILSKELKRRAEAHQLRALLEVDRIDGVEVGIGGRIFTNFASNDYLGLSRHPSVLEAARNGMTKSLGATASPLVCGYTHHHHAAELALARWKGTSSARLLPSGYQASHAIIQTLSSLSQFQPSRPVRFLLDKLCHASLIDAVIASQQPYRVFPHNHLEKLERLLAEGDANQLQVVITESIFSMDGDAAELEGLARLKEKHSFVLVLDEAHGSGVYGPAGAGYAAEKKLHGLADVTLVTLSKALGLMGGAICASEAFCHAVVNFGRAFIYSTAIAPALAAAIPAALRVMADEPQRQQRVRQLAIFVRWELLKLGFEMPPGDSPIIPLVFGREALALEASQRLHRDGLLVIAIRPPTVAPGTSRLRITLSAAHSDQHVDALLAALKQIRT